MSESTLTIERLGAVCLLTVNRPEKRNALNAATRRAFIEALETCRSDEGVRVAVLTGAGDKAFIAGADITEFAGRLILLLRSIGAEGAVMLTGGLARDAGMIAALRELAGDDRDVRKGGTPLAVRTHPDSMLAGAIGAALLGAYRHRQLEQAGRAELVA